MSHKDLKRNGFFKSRKYDLIYIFPLKLSQDVQFFRLDLYQGFPKSCMASDVNVECAFIFIFTLQIELCLFSVFKTILCFDAEFIITTLFY